MLPMAVTSPQRKEKEMTKRKMMTLINAFNVNRDIKWDVQTTKGNGIVVLTNDYADEVEFVITKVAVDDGEDIMEWIKVRDTFMGTTVAFLIKGSDRWSDFKEWDDGLGKAIVHTVKSFYSRY